MDMQRIQVPRCAVYGNAAPPRKKNHGLTLNHGISKRFVSLHGFSRENRPEAVQNGKKIAKFDPFVIELQSVI